MTNQVLIGQRLVAGFPGTAITPELVQVIRQYKIGNIILFRENISDASPAAHSLRGSDRTYPQRDWL